MSLSFYLVATSLEAHAGATPPATPPTTPASLREESDSDEEEELPEGWERRVVGGASFHGNTMDNLVWKHGTL